MTFDNVCEYIGNENECQFIMKFLIEKMNGTCVKKTFRNKLIEKYGDDKSITASQGKKKVVCFKNASLKILPDAWYNSKKQIKDKERIKDSGNGSRYHKRRY